MNTIYDLLSVHLSPVDCSAHLWAVKVGRGLVIPLVIIDLAFWHLAEQVSRSDLDGETDDIDVDHRLREIR